MSKFRPHQENAIQTSVQNDFQSGVHFHATGTGKSWIALQLIVEFQKKNNQCNILWICEQKSILHEQFEKSVLKQRGFHSIHEIFLVLNYSNYKDQEWHSVVNASYVWKKPILVIINRAFLVSGCKYRQLNIPIHLIIHDECHSISNRTTREFYAWALGPRSTFPLPKCIGFSATPNLKHKPFTHVLSHYSIYDAYVEKMIVPPRIQWLKSETVLSFFEIGPIVAKQIQCLPYKKLVVWCGLIEHAYQLAESWKQFFPDFYIEVDTSRDDMHNSAALCSEFYNKKHNALLFCAAKHREGSDIPYLDGCIFLDKVEERTPRTFIQCIGRVLRKDADQKKKFGLVLDLRAASSMDVINRIQPYIRPEIKFPWKYNSYKFDAKTLVHQIDMIEFRDKSEMLSVHDPTIEEIKMKFVRPIPESEIYQLRLEEELSLFAEKKLFPYLLRALDILSMTSNMPHVTRGSCGSSLVCYLLGISHVDPVHYNISFARFLNVHRNTLPDIDFDFPYNLRKDVFFKLEEKYPNKIARISNHVYYHDKSAVREAIRSCGFRKFIAKHDIPNFLKSLTPEMRKRIEEKTEELDGTFRTYSLHCGGIVYYPDGVPEDKVLQKNKSSVLKQITLNKEDVAKEKHFKIDILSSRALAVLVDIGGPGWKVSFENPILDDKVFDMLCIGDNIGITLAESPLMRKTLMKFKPKSIEDLALCLSIIRPAAKNARDADPEDLEEDEDDMFIYDDDAIKIISRVVGCSEGDADKYRRIFSKSDKKGIEEFRQMLEQIALAEEDAEHLLLCLKQLTKYSFCKSHAFSYAQLVYQLAYFKYHKPQDFWRAVLKHSEGSYKKWVHLYEAQIVGLDTTSKGDSKKEISIYANNRKNKIYELQTPLDQLKKYGYWTFVGDLFFPGCYCFEAEPNLWKINGIIASIKLVKRGNQKSVCIMFLGVGRKRYLEVIVHNLKFVHSKWVGCKISGNLKDRDQQVYEATKFYFY